MILRFEELALSRFVSDVFRACGLSRQDALSAAGVLMYADRSGVLTHGVANLTRIYVPKLLSGEIRARAQPEPLVSGRAVALLDGQHGLGLVVGGRAMSDGIELARRFGIGVVCVRRSSHFGAAGYYTAQAAAAGMVGIAMTNLGAQAIAPGPHGGAPVVGTNPISVGVPAGDEAAFLLDMSTTVVSTGRVRAALAASAQTPIGWLQDKQGRDVRDPSLWVRGEATLRLLGHDLPRGAYKGFGLALAVDLLAGVLPGASVGTDSVECGEPSACRRPDIGHLFMALDVDSLRPIEAFREAVDALLRSILAASPDPGAASYPGLPERQSADQAKSAGIAVHDATYSELRLVAARLNLTAPEPVGSEASGEEERR